MGVPQYPVTTFRATAKRAPNGIPRTLGLVLEALVRVLVALITTPANVVTWLIFRPPIPLRLFLLTRIVKYSRSLTPYLLARESRVEASNKPARPVVPYNGIDKNITTTNVTVPPAKHQPAAPAQVKPVEAYGFILTPNGAKGKGADKAQPGEKIIIYYHGGAYVVGHPLWTPFALQLARDARVRVYAAQYRKAVDATSAWPAQLQDGLAAWEHVTGELGFEPHNVILAGESAGGHLSVAVSTQLGQWDAPGPGALALCSPWVDVTRSFTPPAASWIDYLEPYWGGYHIPSLVRYVTPEGERSVLLSPALAEAGAFDHLAKGKTSVFVSVGTAEAISPEIYALITRLKGDGVKVSVFEDENGLHIAPAFALFQSSPKQYTKFAAGVKALVKDIDAANKERAKEAKTGEASAS
ncbi:hypothetical protein VHUM_00281 [Vanrija humicola]|uniref:Alpha/beta hydrolase fold-3 domain-containing protein n=1 Tax=Vanrija humicola TaxID=5417 RepID=A0A7D8Z3B2_VANHU|nr:hypothetical protein VHUM_00281 [Vanrija humicola]